MTLPDEPCRLELLRPDRTEAAWLGAAKVEEFARIDEHIDDFLSNAERDAYRALVADRRRKSWLLGRVAAKRAAAASLETDDLRALEIARGIFGDPRLCVPMAHPPGLSISHAGPVAVAVAHPAGHVMAVDVEEVRPRQADAIASQLTPREVEWAGGDHPRLTALWTAKEALSKALRCGLTAPFRLLETKDIVEDNVGCLTGRFENFGQYRFVARVEADAVLTLVLPFRTEVRGAPFDPRP